VDHLRQKYGLTVGGVCPRLLFYLFEQIRRVGNRAACGNIALANFKCSQKPAMMVVLLTHASNGVAHHFRGVAVVTAFDFGFDVAIIHRRKVYVHFSTLI
jgi:hypothetical protein